MDETPIWLKLGLTFVVVVLNGFFVAAEFALVKARPGRVAALAREGSRPAQVVQGILGRLDLYLSGCQLGITLASLVLGWLAEPAVASLLIALAESLGWHVGDTGLLHVAAIAIALVVITLLHMTIGEQAPKIWAIERSEQASLLIAYPLYIFVLVFQPLIWVVNQISNGMLRLVGVHGTGGHEATHNVSELKQILGMAATGGKISFRQRLFAENVLGLVNLEVRHIILPRVDAVFLSLQKTKEDNLAIIHSTGHSRYPLCTDGLDSVIGIVHARDVLGALLAQEEPDLEALAKKPFAVPTTQPLSQFIVEAQTSRRHCAVAIDERGTTVGLAFLEDALEEIVGPIHDEFDQTGPVMRELPDGCIELPGNVPLPDVADMFGSLHAEDVDTIGGYIIARLGRLPVTGDTLELGEYVATIATVSRQRITRIHLRPLSSDED